MTSVFPLPDLGKLLAIAGEATFAKGMLLAKAGNVHPLVWQGNCVSARVTGSHDYQVTLKLDEEGVPSKK